MSFSPFVIRECVYIRLCAEAAVDVKMKAIGAVSNILAVSNKVTHSDTIILERQMLKCVLESHMCYD